MITGGRKVRKGCSVGFTGDMGREDGSCSLCSVAGLGTRLKHWRDKRS